MFHPRLILTFVFLVAIAFVLIWAVVRTIDRCVTKRRMEQTLHTELDSHNLLKWQSSEKIKDLLSLYMNMCIKHGPNSEEAKSFRFGIENEEFHNLYGKEALDAFNMIADCFKRNFEKQYPKKCKA